MRREGIAQPCLELRPVGVGHQIVVDEGEALPEMLQQVGAGRVLQLVGQRQIISHVVLADPHQRPLVADQRNAFLRGEHMLHGVAQCMQGRRVVIKAVIAKRVCVGEDELGAAFERELLLPLGQQEALLLACRSFANALGANRDLPDLVVGSLKAAGVSR